MKAPMNERIHTLPRFSDARILLGIVRFKGWSTLGDVISLRSRNAWAFFFPLLSRILLWSTELFSHSLRMILHIRFGKQSIGYLLVVCTLFLLLLWNNANSFESVFNLHKGLYKAFLAMISSHKVCWTELKEDMWNPRSTAMAMHIGVFSMSAALQLIGLAVSKTWSNPNPIQKGDSIFYAALGRIAKTSHSFFITWFEPAICMLFGLFFWYQLEDHVYGGFLIVASMCLWGQELFESAGRKISEL